MFSIHTPFYKFLLVTDQMQLSVLFVSFCGPKVIIKLLVNAFPYLCDGEGECYNLRECF